MGNSESRQIATVLSTACQRADDNFLNGWQQDPEVLVALGDFLRHIELVWDKLPVSFTDVIKSKFLPRFTSSTDPEVWVIQQIFCKSIDNPADYVYNQLTNVEPLSNLKTSIEIARRNLWLVAFAQLREQFESKAGRDALANYLKGQDVRKKCATFASAGQRLQSAAISVGGHGALICGLAVPYSTLTKPQRFENLKLENIRRTLNLQSLERCETHVSHLLSLYQIQMHSWMARGTPATLSEARGSIVDTQVVTSGDRKGHATLTEPSQSGIDDCELLRAQSSRACPVPGLDVEPPRPFDSQATACHPSTTPYSITTDDATPPFRRGHKRSFSGSIAQASSIGQAPCAAPSAGNLGLEVGTSGNTQQQVATPNSEELIIRPSNRNFLGKPRCATAVSFENKVVFQLNRTDARGFFSGPHSPSLPQALLVSENLLRTVKVYFENSCRNMKFDNLGNLLAPTGAKLENKLCSDFDSYCFNATLFMGKGLPVAFRRSLSKATALVEHILRAEHPRTLACFLEVFIHLIQTGLHRVSSFLCDYIKRMSAKVIRKENLWGQICQLLGELDTESLDQTMAQIWKCNADVVDRALGMSSRFAVSVRLDYIKRVVTNHFEEERVLRDLLAQFGNMPQLPTPRVMLNLAHNLSKQARHDEAEKMALEVLHLLQRHEIFADRIVERIESLKIISRSQFDQGNIAAAEQNMRAAIQTIAAEWGIQHPWVAEFMNVLEGWLRSFGRNEAANSLRGGIDELMGEDEIDEWALGQA